MGVVIVVDNTVETLFSPRDFQALVDKHMGFHAMRYFRELVDEIEELRGENADLEKEIEELRGETS